MKSRSVNARGHTIAFFLGCKSKKKATMDLLGGFGQHTCTVPGWLAAWGAGRLASRLASRLAGQQPLSWQSDRAWTALPWSMDRVPLDRVPRSMDRVPRSMGRVPWTAYPDPWTAYRVWQLKMDRVPRPTAVYLDRVPRSRGPWTAQPLGL